MIEVVQETRNCKLNVATHAPSIIFSLALPLVLLLVLHICTRRYAEMASQVAQRKRAETAFEGTTVENIARSRGDL